MVAIGEFINAVIAMRRAQNRYYRTRAQSDLIVAKEAEARVDALLGDHVSPRSLQLDLPHSHAETKEA